MTETGMIQAPRQIKYARVKMIQTLNPGMESNRLKTGARQDTNNWRWDTQLNEIYQGVKAEASHRSPLWMFRLLQEWLKGTMKGITKAVSTKAKQRNKNKQHINKIMSPGMFQVGINSLSKSIYLEQAALLYQKKKKRKGFTLLCSRTPPTNLCCCMNVKECTAEPEPPFLN